MNLFNQQIDDNAIMSISIHVITLKEKCMQLYQIKMQR